MASREPSHPIPGSIPGVAQHSNTAGHRPFRWGLLPHPHLNLAPLSLVRPVAFFICRFIPRGRTRDGEPAWWVGPRDRLRREVQQAVSGRAQGCLRRAPIFGT